MKFLYHPLISWSEGMTSLLVSRFRQALFARKIPKLRESVSSTIGKLTAEKVLLPGYVESICYIKR